MKSTTSRKRSSTTKAGVGRTASQKNTKAKTLKKAYCPVKFEKMDGVEVRIEEDRQDSPANFDAVALQAAGL